MPPTTKARRSRQARAPRVRPGVTGSAAKAAAGVLVVRGRVRGGVVELKAIPPAVGGWNAERPAIKFEIEPKL